MSSTSNITSSHSWSEKLVSEFSTFSNPRNIQVQDGHFLGNVAMLIMGIVVIILSVFLISFPSCGISLTSIYSIGGLGLSIGLVLSGVSLWMFHSNFIQRTALLRKHTKILLREVPDVRLFSEISKPERNPVVSFFCPHISNSEKDPSLLLHPFSLKRQVLRIASIILGIAVTTLGVLTFTIFSAYISTPLMIALGVLFISVGVILVLLGIVLHRTQVINSRLYASEILSVVEKLILKNQLKEQELTITKLLAFKNNVEQQSDKTSVWDTLGSWFSSKDKEKEKVELQNLVSGISSLNSKLEGIQGQVKGVEAKIDGVGAHVKRSNRAISTLMHKEHVSKVPIVKKKALVEDGIKQGTREAIVSSPTTDDYQSCTEDNSPNGRSTPNFTEENSPRARSASHFTEDNSPNGRSTPNFTEENSPRARSASHFTEDNFPSARSMPSD